jgi:hypothetical protein
LKHLDLILRETLHPSITSNLLVPILEQTRLEIGHPCIDGNWQLDTFGLQICEDQELALVDNCPSPPLLSTDDQYLMLAFASAGYQKDTLSKLNQCRMFLKAVTLSDLCTADGISLTYDAYNGRPSTQCRELGWPRSPLSPLLLLATMAAGTGTLLSLPPLAISIATHTCWSVARPSYGFFPRLNFDYTTPKAPSTGALYKSQEAVPELQMLASALFLICLISFPTMYNLPPSPNTLLTHSN